MSDDNRVSVRGLGPEDWRIKRELRLAALKADEQWFGGNYADSAARTEQQWRDWPDGAVFAAYLDEEPVGLVAGVRPEHLDGQAELISMWVGSAGRGHGLAGLLVDAVAAWAREQGCTDLYLEVMPHNESACRAYRRSGFAEVAAPVRNAGDIAMRYRL
ncbi:GNAT family N-acetyltransferase [Stackebrandtia nassauensis]|uniref:GCN5-related N-acetyltransferase n=1 Tax=Stackebrandtia nassauensis (strain DSM 44728 / CIP 108903 / NRRL B-16338 / NBRC 102104 / LLR-40K-21) TaxID=446470 RepID=D3PYG2_STANL|nr:GNAT family N-acetyltransferase [Stackebrandtia nassauensis]ADD41529.1 GCN5-related N-acetyltransferase [Stackebrandtia nassauensis DSM 44728]